MREKEEWERWERKIIKGMRDKIYERENEVIRKKKEGWEVTVRGMREKEELEGKSLDKGKNNR